MTQDAITIAKLIEIGKGEWHEPFTGDDDDRLDWYKKYHPVLSTRFIAEKGIEHTENYKN